jgi:glycosyltransferase involved in cell wall biosynthesis
MEKTKVLMVLISTNVGGAEMFVLNLLKNMDLTRFQVDLVVSLKENENGIGKEFKALGCHIYTLPYFKVFNYIQYQNAWKAFLLNHRYDIVHGHATNSAAIYLRIAKKMGCVTIAHCHSAGYRGNCIQRLLKYYFSKRVGGVADYWFACSEKAAEHLYGKPFSAYKKFYMIPNAINTDKYLYDESVAHRVRQELGLGKDSFVCGHVGSFTPPKNHMYLLDIFYEVIKRIPNAKLLCCGEGALMFQFKEKARQLGIADKLILPGIVKNANEYLMAMDVFIFPSLFEGFPISVIESEATGLPVVMSDAITQEADLLDSVKRCSLNDNPAKWADVVCGIEKNDRQACNYIISNSKYNMLTTARLVMSLYDEMINNI